MSVPQPGPTQSSLQLQQDAAPSGLSWEGERMFNIYIHDYCHKRGFRKTARELMTEADIPPESSPPINARQGLLFEWWSVFWVLFTAKANNNGPEEAMLYMQHQAQQQRQAAQRIPGPPIQQLPIGQQPQPSMQPQPLNRHGNGIPSRPGLAFPSSMSNGISGHMQPGGPTSFPMQGSLPNGLPGQPGPPQPSGGPPQQPQNFSQMHPGRSSLSGPPQPQNLQQPPQSQQPPQQRGQPNGPFQSPTMAHSPQNLPGQQQPPPMSQLPGPSPHLQHLPRGMHPPQGMNPMNPQQGPGPGGNPPTAPSQFRSPSRTGTPGQGQGGMLHPSPSMASRQPPGMTIAENGINAELMHMPQSTLQQLKQEAGLATKDFSSLMLGDKQRILQLYQQRKSRGQPPPNNATPGPSNPMMQPPNPVRNKRSSTSPGEEHANIPRNESSPPGRKRAKPNEPNAPPMGFQQHPQQQQPPPGGQPHMMMQHGMIPRNPMMVGGLGPGPGGMNGAPVSGPGPGPGPGPHPGVPQMGGPPMNMGMGMGGQPMGVPQMGNAMGPAPGSQMGHPMTPHMQPQYRMNNKGMMPQQGGPSNMAPSPGSASDPSTFNLGAPPGGHGPPGPSFNPVRMGQKNMLPPPTPSPGMNGPKDQSGGPSAGGVPNNQNGKNQGPNQTPTNSDGSPRNQPPNVGNNAGQTPNAGGTGPPTPAPQQNPQQQQSQQQQQQNPGQGQAQGQIAPSPSSLLGVGPDPLSANIFSTDFIQSVASSLDEFDPGIFRPDGDINFERDFGQWFNQDAMGGSMDAMK